MFIFPFFEEPPVCVNTCDSCLFASTSFRPLLPLRRSEIIKEVSFSSAVKCERKLSSHFMTLFSLSVYPVSSCQTEFFIWPIHRGGKKERERGARKGKMCYDDGVCPSSSPSPYARINRSIFHFLHPKPKSPVFYVAIMFNMWVQK